MQRGDAPYLTYLANNYAMSDNYHQAAMGGTGTNHIMMGTGDAIWFSDGAGNPQVPPHRQLVGIGSANEGYVDEVEDPDPMPTTNNWYPEDGYGGGSFGSPSYGGGSYSNCADTDAARCARCRQLPRRAAQSPSGPNCDPGHYYLLNNYNPGYFGDGSNAYTDNNNANTVFTIPPSSVRNIGDELLQYNVSFAYYGDQFDRYLQDKYEQNPLDVYCNICNFFQYSTSIMTNPQVRTAHLKDTIDLYSAIQSGNLPAVSYVKPSGLVDGHPASSKLDLFEGFVKKIVDQVQANPTLWAEHGDLRHLRRRRRLLRFGLYPAGRLLRRRHAHSDDRSFAFHNAGQHLAPVQRSRLDPEVHRVQLEPAPDHQPQPRQPAQPGSEPG